MAISTATLEGPETRASVERAVRKIKEGIGRAEHLREDVIERAKRQPVTALAVAFGVGIAMGALLGWTWRRPNAAAQA
jgi:hypothetical protein